ncbi:MAG: hypothetical protein IJU02_07040 [Lachnospiraceae bacterium]|nr:hypothetical protein [Lachnospiraceae bacterium]
MILIQPNVTLLKQGYTLDDIKKHIEICARTCYKSVGTETSYQSFIDKLISSGHLAMLEHGTVYLKRRVEHISKPTMAYRYKANPYSRVNSDEVGTKYITTNLRVIVENGWKEDLKYLSFPERWHDKRITLRIITDIGLGRELCRHKILCVA